MQFLEWALWLPWSFQFLIPWVYLFSIATIIWKARKLIKARKK